MGNGSNRLAQIASRSGGSLPGGSRRGVAEGAKACSGVGILPILHNAHYRTLRLTVNGTWKCQSRLEPFPANGVVLFHYETALPVCRMLVDLRNPSLGRVFGSGQPDRYRSQIDQLATEFVGQAGQY